MRALMPLMSSRGTPELRRSHSMTTSSMEVALASRISDSSAQSPKTTLSPTPKTLAEP